MKGIYIGVFVTVLSFISLGDDIFEKVFNNYFESDTTSILIEEDKGSNSWIDIIRSQQENVLTIQTRKKDSITSLAGYGNSEITHREDGSIALDKVNFETDSTKEYVLSTYIKGSTYGSSVVYIIYKAKQRNTWEVFRLPFERVKIIHNHKLGYSIIASYDKPKVVSYYTFDVGIITEI